MINGQLFLVAHIPAGATKYAWGGVLPTMPRHASRCPTRDPLSDAPHPCIDGFAHRAPLLRPFARSRRVRPCSRSPVLAFARVRVRDARARAGARVRPRGGTPRAPCDTPLQTFSPNIWVPLKSPKEPLRAPSIPQPPKCLGDP
jgi:hypothetical protein